MLSEYRTFVSFDILSKGGVVPGKEYARMSYSLLVFDSD